MLKTLSFIKVITIVILYSLFILPSFLIKWSAGLIGPHCKLVVYQSEESVLFLKLL